MSMHACWEQVRDDLGFIRVGAHCEELGDPYEFMVAADYRDDLCPELKGLSAHLGYTRAHRDALALCLLIQGFSWWQRKRYKKRVPVPMLVKPIRLSSTFFQELKMSVQVAHDATVNHFTKAVSIPGDSQLSALTQDVLSALIDMHAWYLANPGATGEMRVTQSLGLVKALDALKAYGHPLQNAAIAKDTPQQVAVRHSVASLAPLLKHLANELVAPTGLTPPAV